MITEITFIREYTSFWRTLSPLSEDFVRYINLCVLDRFDSEINSVVSTSRRALINETGFELFALCRNENINLGDISPDVLFALIERVSLYISRLRNGGPQFIAVMTDIELNEAQTLAKRLLKFFSAFENIVIRPEFPGCGRLNTCMGDVLADETLYEVKSGGRQFRSIDLRQLILYLALNKGAERYDIRRLGLLNPRKGFNFVLPQNEFSLQFSGLTSSDLCHKILYELTLTEDHRFEHIS